MLFNKRSREFLPKNLIFKNIFKLTVYILLIFLLIFTIQNYVKENYLNEGSKNFQCYNHSRSILYEKIEENVEPLPDILEALPKPTSGENIFFIETSCPSVNMYEPNLIKLSTRQICAIESAAIHNPKSNIFLVYSNRKYRNKYVREPLLDTLLFYKNVYLRNVNLWSFVDDTPVEKWFKTGKLFESHFITIHLSDFLRLLLLWRYGGTYLDLDTITLKSLESMPHNYAGIQSESVINQAVLKISINGDGHQHAEQFLLDYQQKFSAIYWAHNGPSLITRVLKRTCCTDIISKMINNPKCCKDFNVYPRNAFYEISFEEFDYFFDEALLDQMLNRTKNSFVLHLWNKFSQQRKMKVGSNVAYDLLAQIHCPRTYAKAGEYF